MEAPTGDLRTMKLSIWRTSKILMIRLSQFLLLPPQKLTRNLGQEQGLILLIYSFNHMLIETFSQKTLIVLNITLKLLIVFESFPKLSEKSQAIQVEEVEVSQEQEEVSKKVTLTQSKLLEFT